MQVSVEKVSNVERRLTIVVPANQIQEEYTKQINLFAKKANVKGFRPGKVPMSYIKRRFGDDVRKEALNEIIQKTLYAAITEKNLKPVSTPQIEPKFMTPDQPFEFVASFEVLPEIQKIQFSINHIEKPVVEVKDEDVNLIIEQLRKQQTKWNIVERAAHEKDRVVINYYLIFEGKSDAENKITNYPIELGSKIMLPGFEDELIGTKAGEEKTIHLNYPTDFKIEKLAGKPVDFVVQIKQVFEAETPAIDENFFYSLGIKSGKEEDLKQQIRQSLEHERDRLVRDKLKEQIFRQLLEQNPFEVPNSLVAREAKNIHDELFPQHQHHDHQQHSNEEMTLFNDTATKRVALGLLIAEYAKQADLKTDKDRVHKRIREIADAYNNPQEVIEWLSADERRGGIEAQVMEEQVMDKLIEGISIIDKTMSYAELKGIRI